MSIPSSSQGTGEWLLFIYSLPARAARARVQAWRRLQRIGAVLLKNSAYALPASAESREDLEWVRSELAAAGGQAMVLIARAPDVAVHNEVVGAFRPARDRDFDARAPAAARLLAQTKGRAAPTRRRELTQRARRLRERFEEAARLDFYEAPQRRRAADLIGRLDETTGRSRTMESTVATPTSAGSYRGKVWVTRPRPGVDRMSSAWLIQRFIDPEARFVFTDPAKTRDAIPFDTFEAEFGHHGPHCTFETFLDRFRISDPAVRRIGRVVHDLDLKENAYDEPETATIGRLVEGLRRTHQDDAALLRSGIDMFEALYQSIAAAASTAPSRRAVGNARGSRKGPRSKARRR
jgi:hypothetical protein